MVLFTSFWFFSWTYFSCFCEFWGRCGVVRGVENFAHFLVGPKRDLSLNSK